MLFGATRVGNSMGTNSTVTFTYHGIPIRGSHFSAAYTNYRVGPFGDPTLGDPTLGDPTLSDPTLGYLL